MAKRDTKWDGVPAAQLGASELQERAARNLTWARELLFPSGAAAARAFGQNPVTYSRYESGSRKIPISLLIRLCDGPWGFTLDYFYRSDLSGLPNPLAVRLAVEHPVLLEECPPRGMPGAPSDPSGEGGTSRPCVDSRSSRAKARIV